MPKMPGEKWDFPESSAEYRPSETTAVKVKFRGPAPSLLKHVGFALS